MWTSKRKVLAIAVSAVLLVAPAWLAAEHSADQKEPDHTQAGPRHAPTGDRPPHRRFDGNRQHGGPQGRQRGRPMHDIMVQLELTEDQKQEVYRIMGSHREQWQQWRQRHSSELEQIKEEMRKLEERRHKLMADAPNRKTIMEGIRPILDSRQQTIFDKKMQEFKAQHERRKQMRDRRRGTPGPPPGHGRGHGPEKNRHSDKNLEQ